MDAVNNEKGFTNLNLNAKCFRPKYLGKRRHMNDDTNGSPSDV